MNKVALIAQCEIILLRRLVFSISSLFKICISQTATWNLSKYLDIYRYIWLVSKIKKTKPDVIVIKLKLKDQIFRPMAEGKLQQKIMHDVIAMVEGW